MRLMFLANCDKKESVFGNRYNVKKILGLHALKERLRRDFVYKITKHLCSYTNNFQIAAVIIFFASRLLF